MSDYFTKYHQAIMEFRKHRAERNKPFGHCEVCDVFQPPYRPAAARPCPVNFVRKRFGWPCLRTLKEVQDGQHQKT